MNTMYNTTNNPSKKRMNPIALIVVTIVLFASGISEDIEPEVKKPVASINIKHVLASS